MMHGATPGSLVRGGLSARFAGIECGLWLAWIAVAVVYAPGLVHAAFLSDDAAILATVYQWHRADALWQHVGSLFLGRLPTGNNYYRPIPFVSFALDWVWFGTNAAGWRLTSLVLHLLSTACVYALARGLIGDPSPAAAKSSGAPLAAALLFGLSPAGPEVVTWIAGRYDALATAAVLVSLWAWSRSRSVIDRWMVASWVAAAAGFACKESAALVIPAIALLALQRVSSTHPRLDRAFASRVAAYWLPLAALTAIYMAWRWHVFHAVFQVYTGEPVEWRFPLGASIESIVHWFGGLVPEVALRVLILAATAVILACALALARTLARVAAVAAGSLVLAALAIALVLPHKPIFAATGEDARLVYTASAFMAVAVAAALAVLAVSARRAAQALALVVVAATALATVHNAGKWAAASRSMSVLLTAIRAQVAAIPHGGYALLIVPDHLGAVPFARNAQGALVSPPLQPSALSTSLVPSIPDDIDAWYVKLGQGAVPALRTLPLARVPHALRGAPADPLPAAFLPTEFACWNDPLRRIVALDGIATATADRWHASMQRALAAAGCD
ncbi:MAG: hypothetical protein JSS46_15990 [Proteobacteria bacterium]|nr:hypothetical protein [Pseudomonadota bacterium]